MDWTSAPNTVDAPLEPARSSFLAQRISAVSGQIEQFLEAERAQLPLWFAVAFGTGIAAWLCLPGEREWAAFLALAIGLASAGLTLGPADDPPGQVERGARRGTARDDERARYLDLAL